MLWLFLSCAPPTGPIDRDLDGFAEGVDCDDLDPSTSPGSPEYCNHADDNCDGLIDDDAVDAQVFWEDADGDGHGATEVLACVWRAGLTGQPGDCDDTNAEIHPGAPEDECRDELDYNCDGEVGWTDADFDGWPACEDCDDTDPNSFPGGTEVCDGRDNDCDRTADEEGTPGSFRAWADDDGDTYGDPTDSRLVCAVPVGFVLNGEDCDDTDAAVHPGATEVEGDAVDQNCDGRA